MMYSDRTFGLIVFSSVIALHCAKLINPLHMLKVGRRSLKSTEPEETEVVQVGAASYHSRKWRKLRSRDTESELTECKLEIINDLDETVVFCWIDQTGRLRNFYPIADKSIKDNSVTNKHHEGTHIGHSFVAIRRSNNQPRTIDEVDEDSLIFCCTMRGAGKKTVLTLNKYEAPKRTALSSLLLRGSSRVTPKCHVSIRTEEAPSAADIIDTTGKVYHERMIRGFRVKYEPGVFEDTPGLEETLDLDLGMVCRLFPAAACRKLQESTAFWVNKSLTYGTVQEPVVATCCHFHPMGDSDWLRCNGLHTDKEGAVEMCSATEYLRSRQYWGDGGIVVHELTHAYHNKYCPEGFDCGPIRRAYDVAMERKLYDSVRVHGPQGANGATAKAYACANCMEFWAELSVAYLWAEDEDTEYNKWFPFNRAQLRLHDPDTYAVLDEHWHLHDEK